MRTQGDVHIAAHLPLLHIGVRNAAADEDLLQALEVGVGLFRAAQIGGGDNFHQRGAATVVIHQRIGAEVRQLGGVLLQVNVVQLHAAHHGALGCCLGIRREGPGIQRYFAPDAQRQVQLARLIILRHVRVKIVLAVPTAHRRGRAAQHQTREHGSLDGVLIEHRQCPGHAEAGGAYIRVRFIAEAGLAAAEHLGFRLNLAVYLQAYGDDVVFNRHVFLSVECYGEGDCDPEPESSASLRSDANVASKTSSAQLQWACTSTE